MAAPQRSLAARARRLVTAGAVHGPDRIGETRAGGISTAAIRALRPGTVFTVTEPGRTITVIPAERVLTTDADVEEWCESGWAFALVRFGQHGHPTLVTSGEDGDVWTTRFPTDDDGLPDAIEDRCQIVLWDDVYALPVTVLWDDATQAVTA